MAERHEVLEHLVGQLRRRLQLRKPESLVRRRALEALQLDLELVDAETLTTDEVTDEELERAPEFDELGADADENEDTREGRA